MPKVINQTGVSIDSLQAKLTLLETKFSKLGSEHTVLLDSLRGLNKTIEHADVATTFYDTHLASYMAYVTILIGIIFTVATVINWKYIYQRSEKLIEEKSKKIEKQGEQIKELENKIESLDISDLQKDLYETSSLVLRTNYLNYLDSNPHYALLFSLRVLKLLAKWGNNNIKDGTFEIWLKNSENILAKSTLNERYGEVYFDDCLKCIDESITGERTEDELRRLKDLSFELHAKIAAARSSKDPLTTTEEGS